MPIGQGAKIVNDRRKPQKISILAASMFKEHFPGIFPYSFGVVWRLFRTLEACEQSQSLQNERTAQ